MRWIVWSLCWMLAACARETESAPTFERPLDLRAEVNKEKARLLEPVDLKITLYHDKDLKVDFSPKVPKGFDGKIEARRRHRTQTGEVLEYAAALRPVRLGEVTIPAFTVKAGEKEASSSEILIQVGSVLGENADLAAIEAPAPLFPPRVHYWRWILGLGGFLVIVLLGIWLLRRPRKVIHATQTPLLPHVKALRALARLKGVPRQTEAEVEAFYVDVSMVLRVYLEERFGLHAPERTTEEFLAEIERGDTLSGEQRQSLRQFLEQCDLVKFARLIPHSQVHDKTFQIAMAFVEQTRPDRIPAGGAA
jgi:Domain of unknown function (DUF4381)